MPSLDRQANGPDLDWLCAHADQHQDDHVAAVPCTPGVAAPIGTRPPPQTAYDGVLASRRYGGADTESTGIVDRALPKGAVLSTTGELAKAQRDKAGDTAGGIKARIYAPAPVAPAALRDTARQPLPA
ncbi:hypothetical protein [Streptomyces sp. NBC_00096]|uniref:hypothetical protein n=1 Tax=Streptomyces sp. NBC_00096 TaxID=2975650 RepID=UPI003252FB56